MAHKPPSGVMPQELWVRFRIANLLNAMNRRALAGLAINHEWIEELAGHIGIDIEICSPSDIAGWREYANSDRYTRPSAGAAERTVRYRRAIAVDGDGEIYTIATRDLGDLKEAVAGLGVQGPLAFYTITADVPLPDEPAEIVGTVES